MISRFGPFSTLSIAGSLDRVARPDLALHSVVETMPAGATISVTFMNVAHADRALALLDGTWPESGVRRYFSRESAVEMAGACGLAIDEVITQHLDPSDEHRSAELLGDRADRAGWFTLRCTRTHRGTIPMPTVFAEAVDYTALFQRGDGTCHSREIALLDGRPHIVEVAPAADMTHWLHDLGHRLTIVDRAVPSRSRRWAERVVVGDLDRDDWARSLAGTADAVLLGNVIEHVADPVAVLGDAARCLDRGVGGDPIVVVSVPNVAHADVRLALASGRWTYRDTGILDRTHLHFFTADRLAAVADAAGFDVGQRLSTRVPRGASINATTWDHADADESGPQAPRRLTDLVDADPDADIHVLTWELRPR